MTDKEKEPYVKLNEQSKALYEKEMKQFNELGYYVNSEGIKSTYLNKKHVAQEFEYGTVMPKKVKGAYMFFNAEALKARKPD